MDAAKQQIVEKLSSANNILLTVSRDPSVDQLAACIALTILLNKMDKHATAVFSGKVPSTIDFLKPDETLEKNTDSLRDFIIALDKSKADKLRYKVEDKVVKIFITPYKTSLSSDDLVFSQGDFNVDVVLALGVHEQADLDDAITAHGRILHDATVMCINTSQNGELGSVNWVDQHTSSLSELATELAKSFDKPLLDEQIATALLTGIVAETDRFKNDKTTATTMSLSADLMKAGANQQLVADELEQAVRLRGEPNGTSAGSDQPPKSAQGTSTDRDGTLEINHPADNQPSEDEHDNELPAPVADGQSEAEKPSDTLDFRSHRTMLPEAPEVQPDEDKPEGGDNSRPLITEPPIFGGALTANTQPDNGDLANIGMPVSEPEGPLLERENRLDDAADTAVDDETPPPSAPETNDMPPPSPSTPAPEPVLTPPTPPVPPITPEPPVSEPVFTPPTPAPEPPPPAPEPPRPETLTELEESIGSPHVGSQTTEEPAPSDTSDIDKAREEVMRALNEQPNGLPPIEALNAQPLDLGKEDAEPQPAEQGQPPAPAPQNPPDQAPFPNSPADKPLDMPLPPTINLPPAQTQPPTNAPNDSLGPPPPTPPPFTPGGFGK
jgi:hypothetical protein